MVFAHIPTVSLTSAAYHTPKARALHRRLWILLISAMILAFVGLVFSAAQSIAQTSLCEVSIHKSANFGFATTTRGGGETSNFEGDIYCDYVSAEPSIRLDNGLFAALGDGSANAYLQLQGSMLPGTLVPYRPIGLTFDSGTESWIDIQSSSSFTWITTDTNVADGYVGNFNIALELNDAGWGNPSRSIGSYTDTLTIIVEYNPSI